ncbi:HsdM family class I SAM-dependent methyltransferase [Actinopolyspora halophila]|uniref:HsdM family class I SAM-dependent methyltransferase n=1 Tax=Actinopolyspora halophila TaxID=1850 RepID=UPI0003705CB5|nr:N-6 DNA methylase [Actinopolyspora halophila]
MSPELFESAEATIREPEATRTPEATVSAADIARLAEVGRAAVSNWRRRFGDFPEPVAGTQANPLFELDEVREWFARHDKPFRVSPGDRLWQRIQATVDDIRLGDAVGLFGTCLLLLKRTARRPHALENPAGDDAAGQLHAALREHVPELPAELLPPVERPWLPLLREAADIVANTGASTLFSFLCERYFELHSRWLPATDREVAELLVEVAGVADGDTVLDQACGTGNLLLAAAEHGAERLLGKDITPTFARIALCRLLLAGTAADGVTGVEVGDSLRDGPPGEPLADAVLCSPPFNERSWGREELLNDPRWEYGLPARGESELAWVQHCLAAVRPGGRVVLTMPAAAAGRRSGKRIRANLLRSGALRAVLGLPGQGAGPGPDLWVLRRPDGAEPPPAHVLVLPAQLDPDVVGSAWRAFDAGELAELPEQARPVSVVDLLDEEVDLSPDRHRFVHRRGEAAAAFPGVRQRLVEELDELTGQLPELDHPEQPRRMPTTTIAELAKAGTLVLHQAPLNTVSDAGELPMLTAEDLRTDSGPSGRTSRTPGMLLIRPGDVVLSLSTVDAGPRVSTSAEEGVVLGPRLLLLRPSSDSLDPHFVAGFLRHARNRADHRATSKSSRFDIRSAGIPLLNLAQQREYGRAFQRWESLQCRVHRITDLAETLVRLGVLGLADGSLLPPEDGGRAG